MENTPNFSGIQGGAADVRSDEPSADAHTLVRVADGPVAAAPDRPMSYGERAVDLAFNPSGGPAVYSCKSRYAAAIDEMNDLRLRTASSEVKRMASAAITDLQTAQMWAVKALTWRD